MSPKEFRQMMEAIREDARRLRTVVANTIHQARNLRLEAQLIRKKLVKTLRSASPSTPETTATDSVGSVVSAARVQLLDALRVAPTAASSCAVPKAAAESSGTKVRP